ncbi:MAG: MFS transporter [Pirellulales bacterium]|nr:MFS transporter [Pirellulales bacterium]
MPSNPQETKTPSHRAGELRSRSFLGLLLTQLLGAINDNAFRMLAVGICTAKVSPEHSSLVLSGGLACFTLPYLLLAAPAGYVADRFSKRRVIVSCKAAEIAIMSTAVFAIWQGNLAAIFLVLAMMGAQSALFGPAKLGSIPEMVRAEKLSAANGFMGLVTIVASVLGFVVGNFLFGLTGPDGRTNLWISTGMLIGLASVGTCCSLLIAHLAPANPLKPFPRHAIRETIGDLRLLISNKALLRVALGIAFFWSLGALAQSNILEYGAEHGLRQEETSPLLVALVLGVGSGCVLAGLWSGSKVELGILPLGAGIMVLASTGVFGVSGELTSPHATWTAGKVWACLWLWALGMGAGMFSVPLEAYLQHHSPKSSRGAILAASNFITFAGILASAGAYYVLRLPVGDPSAYAPPALSNLSQQDQDMIAAFREQLIHDWSSFSANHIEGRSEISWDENFPQLAPRVAELREAEVRAAAIGELIRVDQHERTEILKTNLGVRDYRHEFTREADLNVIRFVLNEPTPLFSAQAIFLVVGMLTIPILVYIVILIPDSTVRFLVWLASKSMYRIRVHGHQNLPETGGALLVANHVTWLDGVFLLVSTSRRVRLLVDQRLLARRWAKLLVKMSSAIPFNPTQKSSVAAAINRARAAIRAGDLVCIFPEGDITRSGALGRFKRSAVRIAADTATPVLPVYLDELWGSIFSYRGGRLLWKVPKSWPYPVSIYYGSAIQDRSSTAELKYAVSRLREDALERRMHEQLTPPRLFLRNCRRNRRRTQVADSLGEELTGGQLLLRTLILRRLLLKHVLQEDEKYVGVLIPPSAGSVVVNAAIPLTGRIAVNLNYTLARAELDHCIHECGIKRVLTTRKVLDKLKLEFDAEPFFLEDLREKLTLADKLAGAWSAFVTPMPWLEKQLGVRWSAPDDVLTIIFTSGTTNMPKGVMLTNRNVGSQVTSINEVIQLRDEDILMCILPFFHSMGYTVTIWTVLTLNLKGIYHVSPLDAKVIGRLCKTHQASILIGTPTFLRSYLKRCEPEELTSLDVVVTGAEQLPVDVSNAFEKKFGVRPVEGYGATELSPLVSVNVPGHRSPAGEPAVREGSVGRPIPGVRVEIRDPDSGEKLSTGENGMLWTTGPNVMRGYLGHPEKTAEVIQDGWYKTGDIARLDEDGFVHITGRLSRFSKIGGEMVPHVKLEEALSSIMGTDEDQLLVAVTAVPDERKGERLVVVHTKHDKSAGDICRELSSSGLPRVFIPSPDSFIEVEVIPVLGTGKLDMRSLRKIAMDRLGPGDDGSS